jgi:hypothetical protein
MSDNIRLIISCGLLALVVIAFGLKLLRRSIAKKATKWPLAEGTIESGQMEVVAGGGRSPKVSLPVFAFSYQVQGQYYSGRFALLPYIAAIDDSFISRMIGRKLQVRHDPLRPPVWFIADKLIDGCKVEQKLSRDWINYAPPG